MIDIRRVIGGLFAVYGVIVTLLGIFDSAAEIAKAEGVRINLWAGLGMAAVGAFFLGWERLRPAQPLPNTPSPDDDDRSFDDGVRGTRESGYQNGDLER